MKPLVSILIPAYNSQPWIAATLRSALAQTWEQKEIIVVDDGSTDDTLKIAQSFASPTVQAVSQKNQGASAARNHAYALSRGSYIQWLDADDLLGPEKIAMQMRAIENGAGPEILLSSGFGKFMYRPEHAQFIPTALWCDLSPADWLVRKLGQNLFMQTSTWLTSRELCDQAGPWNPALITDDDGEYFCRVLRASAGTRFVPESKVYYRASGSGSLSYLGLANKKLDAQWHSMELHLACLRSLEDSQRARQAGVAYLQNWLVHFYPDRPDLVQKANSAAAELGGELHVPRLSWKYSWIAALFGAAAAKRAQLLMPRIRWALKRSIDRTLARISPEHAAENLV
jgi:glycosyltransferase involved in cell wall biosynthesis